MNIKTIFAIMAISATTMPCFGQGNLKSGIQLSNLDRSAAPGNDFYQFACGGWVKNNPLPAAYSRFGSFDRLQQDNNERINGILNELLKNNYAKGTVEQKLSDMYKLAMDSIRRNKEGVKPIMPYIKEIEACKSKHALQQLQKKYSYFGIGRTYSTYFGADEKDAKWNILNINQSGLTLGQKEYYLDNDEATTKIREAYKQHIVNMFKLFGFSNKASLLKMNDVLSVETKLAQVSKSRTELRDVEANYNKISLEEFESRYPNLTLTELMKADGVNEDHIRNLVIGQPDFLAGANTIVGDMTPGQLKSYMEWDLITSCATLLSDEVEAENFDFFGKTMTGRKENHPRWKRATNLVQGMMGESLGKIYVEKYFPAAAKQRMEGLVKNLQVALAQRIEAQDWMDDATKRNALDKLNTFYVKVGYPNKWKDISGMKVDPAKSFCENVIECRRFLHQWQIDNKAGKPVDRDEWHMTPQTVNAYYNPTTNEICFPAGILQVPFFDMTADDAFNYGAIGVVIGHEMTHGFDDQGRHYDKDGNMTDWWTENDGKMFAERADKYADFFSAIKVLPDLNANGKLTLGENLADHGGLQVAFYALKNAMSNNPLGTIDGFTPEQRFFIAYAGVWANNITEAEIRNRTKSDPHSLGKFRVNGALPHIDMWYDAFGVQPTDKMFVPKEQRLSLW
jgi:putative endopeptidase